MGKTDDDNEMEIVLLSPVKTAESLLYKSPSQTKEIIVTIYWACENFPELKPLLSDDISGDEKDLKLEELLTLCESFNRAVISLRDTIRPTIIRASGGLLKHIMQTIYCCVVDKPEKLNQYQPFSPAVYGETSYELTSQLIDQIQTMKGDVFIDLGSGIGQVVLQMAAASYCERCIGIEQAEVPATFAAKMDTHFRRMMAWYGLQHSQYEFIKDDFFNNKYRGKIESATIVFVNNISFGPTVDHNLKLLFADLRDGTRIISSKAFCSLNFRICDRSQSDIGSIMYVTQIEPMHNSVSWTNKPVPYFLHIIDRTLMERYYQKKKAELDKALAKLAEEKSSPKTSPKPAKRRRCAKKKFNNSAEGVMTRNGWKEYCKQNEKNNNNKSVECSQAPQSTTKTYNDTNNNTLVDCIETPKFKIDTNNDTNNNIKIKSLNTAQSTISPKYDKNNNKKVERPKKTRSTIITNNDINNDTNIKYSGASKSKLARNAEPPLKKQKRSKKTFSDSEGARVVRRSARIRTAATVPLSIQNMKMDAVSKEEVPQNLYGSYQLAPNHMSEEKQNLFKSRVMAAILKESNKSRQLEQRADVIGNEIDTIKQESFQLLCRSLESLGISIGCSPAYIVAHAMNMLAEHSDLQTKTAKLETQLAKLEEEHSELVQIRNAEIEAAAHDTGITIPEFVYEKLVPIMVKRGEIIAKLKELSMKIKSLEKKIMDNPM